MAFDPDKPDRFLAQIGDDPDKTPPLGIRRPKGRDLPERKWIVEDPKGRPHVEWGPWTEPPVCAPCEKTPQPMKEPRYPGERECDGCGSRFIPED